MDKETYFNNHLNDDLDDQSKEQLEAWKNEAEENVRYLKEMKQIHDSDLSDYTDVDYDADWQEIKDKLSQEQIAKTTKKPSIKLWTIAASLMILVALVVGIEYLLNSSSHAWDAKEYISQIELKNVELADKTKVTLNKNSNLKVIGERHVSLTGSAYFEVIRNEEIPFTVNTSLGKVEVLGTKFSIDINGDIVTVLVNEGKVRFSNKSRELILLKNDLIIVENGAITKIKNHDLNYLSWKDDKLVFDNTPLVSVIRDIERHYGKKIILKNPKESVRCNLSTVFEDTTFKEVLSELKLVFGLKLTKNGNTIEILDSEC